MEFGSNFNSINLQVQFYTNPKDLFIIYNIHCKLCIGYYNLNPGTMIVPLNCSSFHITMNTLEGLKPLENKTKVSIPTFSAVYYHQYFEYD